MAATPSRTGGRSGSPVSATRPRLFELAELATPLAAPPPKLLWLREGHETEATATEQSATGAVRLVYRSSDGVQKDQWVDLTKEEYRWL